MKSENDIRIPPQIAQAEEFIRHLSILLNNTVRLLEQIMEYVPNQIEWANMLDGIHRDVDASEREVKDFRGYPSKA